MVILQDKFIGFILLGISTKINVLTTGKEGSKSGLKAGGDCSVPFAIEP